jgi:hypothetical protein
MSSQVGENQFGVDEQSTWIFSLFVGLRSIYAHGNSTIHELLAINHTKQTLTQFMELHLTPTLA